MILLGDCIKEMAALPAASVDTCITDPPYNLKFMGKKWDGSGITFSVELWEEIWRILKPGAMLLAFGGTRTYHRMTCAIEDAGFEIRDSIEWIYGSGFPKSLDISKQLDKMAGAEREVIGPSKNQRPNSERGNGLAHNDYGKIWNESIPATDAAKLWDGYGTALKPAHEPIVLAMKPLDGTFANNALRHGVAGLWIDGGRINYRSEQDMNGAKWGSQTGNINDYNKGMGEMGGKNVLASDKGRFPANLILSHAPGCEFVPLDSDNPLVIVAGGESVDEAIHKARQVADAGGYWRCVEGCPVAELDRQSGTLKSGEKRPGGVRPVGNSMNKIPGERTGYYSSSEGGASRFFLNLPGEARFRYVAKASRAERNRGLEGMPELAKPLMGEFKTNPGRTTPKSSPTPRQNHHPTVKPLALMRYLVRLTRTPTGGAVLDPFMGSGTTGMACVLEGREFIGIEQDPDYFEIAKRRIASVEAPPITLSHFEEATDGG